MKSNKRVTLLSSLGAGFEYYDFIIFALMSATLSKLFFPEDGGEITNYMKTFMVFALGYVARPIGGLVFGSIGDFKGRKKSFLLIMFLMALASLIIGCLPTYDVIGGWASVALVILRICQGVSFGAELPGAITLVAEHHKNKSFQTSFIISSISLGSVMATLMSYGINKLLTPDQILNWGWRIPFITGGVLALVNYFIRKMVVESPEFIEAQKEYSHATFGSPLKMLFKNYKMALVSGLFLTLASSTLIITNLFFPVYLSHVYKYDKAAVFSAMTWAVLWCALIMPFMGKIVDRWGAMLVFRLATLGVMGAIGPALFFFNSRDYIALVIFLCVYQTLIAGLMASYMPLVVKLFPTRVRQTGVSLSYNITYALVGFLPTLYTSVGVLNHSFKLYGIIFCIMAVIHGLSYLKPLKN